MILMGTNNISGGSDEEEAHGGVNDGVPIYYSLAEIQLRGADRLSAPYP